METFYIQPEQFWDRFNGIEDQTSLDIDRASGNKSRGKNLRNATEPVDDSSSTTGYKRQKTDSKPRTIIETEAATRTDARYIILYGRHKPGKKKKDWEGDGYLSMVGLVAHVCDLRGRMLEEPTILDEVDYKVVEEMGELTIGTTEIQIIEPDTR